MCSYSQAKALAEKNQRDIQAQREQEERHVSIRILSALIRAGDKYWVRRGDENC